MKRAYVSNSALRVFLHHFARFGHSLWLHVDQNPDFVYQNVPSTISKTDGLIRKRIPSKVKHSFYKRWKEKQYVMSLQTETSAVTYD